MYRTEKYLRRTCFFDGACVCRDGGEIYLYDRWQGEKVAWYRGEEMLWRNVKC